MVSKEIDKQTRGIKKRGGHRPGAGRPKGSVNRATRDVRKVMSLLVEGNIERLEGWLDEVGQKDPAKAFELFLKMLEYHIPKLSRTELAGEDGAALKVEVINYCARGVHHE